MGQEEDLSKDGGPPPGYPPGGPFKSPGPDWDLGRLHREGILPIPEVGPKPTTPYFPPFTGHIDDDDEED
jgi:hypothetical protein